MFFSKLSLTLKKNDIRWRYTTASVDSRRMRMFHINYNTQQLIWPTFEDIHCVLRSSMPCCHNGNLESALAVNWTLS